MRREGCGEGKAGGGRTSKQGSKGGRHSKAAEGGRVDNWGARGQSTVVELDVSLNTDNRLVGASRMHDFL